MENLKDAERIWYKDKGLFVVLLVLIALWALGKYVIPVLDNRAEESKKAQIELLKLENDNCKLSNAQAWHVVDSLRQSNQKLQDERLQDLREKNEKIERANNKYQDAMIQINKANETVSNIQKTVNHEIK